MIKPSQPTCVFRVDGSTQMGMGHIMRCICLAIALQTRGYRTVFLCKEVEGISLAECFKKNGIEWQTLSASSSELPEESIDYLKQECPHCEWLIVDHYGIDRAWEECLLPYCRHLLVIDDLANRPHCADILIDQNYFENKQMRYQGLVSPHCRLLLGLEYLLLQARWQRLLPFARIRKRLSTVLINFGGADPHNETLKALKGALEVGENNIKIVVVVGAAYPYQEKMASFCHQHKNTTYYCQPLEWEYLVNEADLVIGAGGVSLWERMALGVPSVVTCIADNQQKILEDVYKTGCIDYLGLSNKTTVNDYRQVVQHYIEHPEVLVKLSNLCRGWIDGKGVERVVNEMREISEQRFH